MSKARADITSLVFVIVAFVVAALLYAGLPEQIATPWNVKGEVDAYMRKAAGVFMMPFSTLLTDIAMKLTPVISPKGFPTQSLSGVFPTTRPFFSRRPDQLRRRVADNRCHRADLPAAQ